MGFIKAPDFNVGVAFAGGQSKTSKGRRKHDFYPTEPEATESLLRKMPHLAGCKIWENACGAGHIARVLEYHGCEVVGTDLIDRGYGKGEVNFLSTVRPKAKIIVTNPPFELAGPFIEHAMRMHIEEMWLLLKTQFFQAGSRLGLKDRYRPQWKLELSWRVDFTGEGAGTMDCAWFGWHRDHSRGTGWDVLPKPDVKNLDFFLPDRVDPDLLGNGAGSEQGVLL
ncbi:MAG: SAM-dependent DNA methyltransferase [Rhodospirillales bacterium]|nr:SAM-dependent DNA methyltransferase [Rhodospirillales bacterium]MBR9816916.1 SAM-dependent DNA methyltransferase [Rhodospirillales bacterium]